MGVRAGVVFSHVVEFDQVMRGFVAVVACVVLPLLSATGARAQDLEPRAYANTPIGMNFAIAGYAHSQGDIAVDPAVPLEDGDINVDMAIFGYAHTFALWGESAKVAAVVPYACLDGSAKWQGEVKTRDVCGASDPKFGVTVNLHGAPALSLPEFARYQQDLIVGASVYVSAPFGQYDSDRLVNIGTNRWSIKPELAVSKAVGSLTLELAGAVTFFTDNDDFLGGQRREQDPVYAVQGHIIYSFTRGVWAAVNATYFEGGRTTLNGVKANDELANSRAGATLALPWDRQNSIKLYAFTGVSTRIGGDFDTLGLAWQHRWGGGL